MFIFLNFLLKFFFVLLRLKLKGAIGKNVKQFTCINNLVLPMCEQIVMQLKKENFPDFLGCQRA